MTGVNSRLVLLTLSLFVLSTLSEIKYRRKFETLAPMSQSKIWKRTSDCTTKQLPLIYIYKRYSIIRDICILRLLLYRFDSAKHLQNVNTPSTYCRLNRGMFNQNPNTSLLRGFIPHCENKLTKTVVHIQNHLQSLFPSPLKLSRPLSMDMLLYSLEHILGWRKSRTRC